MKNLATSLIAATGTNIKVNPNKWDATYLYIDTDPSNAGVITSSTTSYIRTSSNLASIDTVPTGVYFKPDGRDMYVAGTTGDDIEHFRLEKAFDVFYGTFVDRLSVSSYTTSPSDVFFKPDGTKFYITETQYQKLQEWHLTTPWDITTGSYYQTFDLTQTQTNPTGLYIKEDGTKLYTVDYATDYVYEYNFSSGNEWDISTLSFNQSFDVGSQETSPAGLHFRADGSVMYVIGYAGDDVNQYNLTSGNEWDISTASYQRTYGTGTRETSPHAFYFRPDGGTFFIGGAGGDEIDMYQVAPVYLDYSSVAGTVTGLFFKDDGTKLYLLDDTANDITEYTLSTPWDILSAASPTSVFTISNAYESTPTALFIGKDGERMYCVGTNVTQTVNQFDLTTGWNFSTASHSREISISAQISSPDALSFSSDGDRMYVGDGSTIYEYELTTAWEVNSRSYSHSLSASPETSVNGISFGNEGSKLYIIGSYQDKIVQWDLTTPWDISTATNKESFYANSGSSPQDIFFRPDGLGAYTVDGANDRIVQYVMAEVYE